MLSALEQDAISTTFTDTEKLIYGTVKDFVAKNGGSVDELVGEAGICFMKAYNSYDYSKAKFSTWVHIKVWRHLQEIQRVQLRRESRVTFEELDENRHVSRMFNLSDFLDQLSEDARLVCSVVFDTPWQTQPEPKQIRELLRLYFGQPAVGWPMARISDTFAEIRAVLAETP